MARRTTKPLEDEGPPHTLLEESDTSILEAAEKVFGDMDPVVMDSDEGIGGVELPDPVAMGWDPAPQQPSFGTPDARSFVQVKGGMYLPARRRIMWMRGEPEQHPLWTIDTNCESIKEGTFKANKVEGGYARYRASVFDENGRLISTGTKTEYSERFMDFAEKAETGAIARALAVAGYGTEAALDLDEGIDEERIADAPVADPLARFQFDRLTGRPINITPSDVGGLSVGGRQADITPAQLNEIARLARKQKLGLSLVTVIESVLGLEVPPLPQGDSKATNTAILEFLQSLSFDDASKLIMKMSNTEEK